MRFIGFNFTKINVERKDSLKNAGDLKINTEINVLDIKEIKTDIGIKEDLIETQFAYKVNYEPGYAGVVLEGKIVLSTDPKTTKSILNDWKNQKTAEEFKLFLFNIILKRCTLKALQLEEEVGLPLHLPMPRLGKGKEKAEK